MIARTNEEILARYCEKLDEIASASGQNPLSAFGFNDDLRGETLVWHSAVDGLRTVNALVAAVEAQPAEYDDQIRVVSDLKRLSEALRANAHRGFASASCYCTNMARAVTNVISERAPRFSVGIWSKDNG